MDLQLSSAINYEIHFANCNCWIEDLISFIVQYITIKHLKLLISFHLNVIIIILFERWGTHKKH